MKLKIRDSKQRIQTTITMTAMKTKHIVSNVVNISDPDIGFLCRAAPLRGPCLCSLLFISIVFDHCCFCSGSFLKPVCFSHLICNHSIFLLFLSVSSFISLLFLSHTNNPIHPCHLPSFRVRRFVSAYHPLNRIPAL